VIRSGVESSEYFACAEGQDTIGRYEALTIGASRSFTISPDGLIVKIEIAKAQLQKEAPESEGMHINPVDTGDGGLLSGLSGQGEGVKASSTTLPSDSQQKP